MEVPVELLKLSSKIMSEAAEVGSLASNQLSNTALDIYSYFVSVRNDWRGSSVSMSSFKMNSWLETFEDNVHQIPEDLSSVTG